MCVLYIYIETFRRWPSFSMCINGPQLMRPPPPSTPFEIQSFDKTTEQFQHNIIYIT